MLVVALREDNSEPRTWRTTSRVWAQGMERIEAPKERETEPGIDLKYSGTGWKEIRPRNNEERD